MRDRIEGIVLTDLEVDNAKKHSSLKTPNVKKGVDSLPLVESDEQLIDQEVKEILSQHIPQGSH